MPALWASSQKSMYVRTVWVDGIRHAILGPDDPYNIRRPHSIAICPSRKSRTRHSTSRSTFRPPSSVDFILEPRRSFTSTTIPADIELDLHRIEKLELGTDIEDSEPEELVLNANAQPLLQYDTSRTKYASFVDMRVLRSNRTARTDTKPTSELSERVLQWLDLAGKVDLITQENEGTTRLAQPRHSWPEIQKRQDYLKPKIVDYKTLKSDRNPPEDNTAKTSDRQRDTARGETIDRNIEYHQPARTIENYARSTRNVAAPKTSRQKNQKSNVQEARVKVANEMQAVEKQYAELISKKIIPKLDIPSKRQVHIFMPAIPKKPLSHVASKTASVMS